MKTVWKYTLPIIGGIHIQMPLHSEILSVKNQKENLVMYALIDPEISNVVGMRKFRIVGTGHHISFENHPCYIGSVLFQSGNFVAHVFEELDI